jgi:hypothetical protein
MVFVRGGYPFNFNGKPWNVPANEIEPTQGALFGAVVQASQNATRAIGDGFTINYHHRLMLSPFIQRLIIDVWRKTPAATQHSDELLDCFQGAAWVKKNSGGEYVSENETRITQCFSLTVQPKKEPAASSSSNTSPYIHIRSRL